MGSIIGVSRVDTRSLGYSPCGDFQKSLGPNGSRGFAGII